MPAPKPSFSSQFMQHVYDAGYFTQAEKRRLAHALLTRAAVHDPAVLERMGEYYANAIGPDAQGAEQIARGRELDATFKAFEDKFFTTPEGKKFKAYIANARKGDFSAFSRDHPSARAAGTQAEHLEESAGRQVKRWSGSAKAGAAIAGAGLVAGTGWALLHRQKKEQDQAPEMQASAAR